MFHTIGPNRPEALWQHFIGEEKAEGVNIKGRVTETYREKGSIDAILCGANPEQRVQYQQIGHPITHVITETGVPNFKAGDSLRLGERLFYIRGVDNPGELNIWAVYYCEERSDLNGN